jgi:hypothetical protein
MDKGISIDRLNSVLDQIANVLLVAAQEEMGGDPWELAFLDVRGSAISPALLKKYRIARADRRITALNTPDDLIDLLDEAFALRDEGIREKWYGLLVTIYPDKKCEVKFNYDPNCAKDKTFFET